jgi:phosphoserine aminotransferase
MIYAGAQKNIGPAGVTLVLIRRDLLERIPAGLPVMQDYRTYTENDSLYNTPPSVPIYVVGEVLAWIERNGGLTALQKRNEEKAKRVYEALDASDFYIPYAAVKDRSLMNVTFRLQNESLEAKFIKDAEACGLKGLKGHRSVGGIRASIYNAFPSEGISTLVDFMKTFEAKNG